MTVSPIEKMCWSAFTAWHVRRERQLPYWPPERIQALQSRRVHSLIAHAYETVPYYREVMDARALRPRDFRSAADLSRLPLLTGDQVAREPERFLSRVYAGGRSLQLRSSGTSGRLRSIHYDPAALFVALANGHRQRLVVARFVGRTFGYREMVATRPGSIGTSIRQFYESSSWAPRRIELARGTLSPAAAFADNIGHVNDFRPDAVRGYGSYLGAFFRRAIVEKVTVARPRVIVYGGDRMAEADRLLIESEWGVPVLSTYQAAETLRLGFQCELRRGFHLSQDHVAVRVLDRAGAAVGPGGTGQIVISNLTNHATVLLNYALGDVVTVSAEPCPCGRTLPTIERIDGRADDFIARPGGERVHALIVQPALHRVPGVIQVQIVQEDLRHFQLRVVYVGTQDWTEARRRLTGAMTSVLGDDIVVTIERVDRLTPAPSDKVKAVISHCLART
jgi:phenylacetate-CoA ligase